MSEKEKLELQKQILELESHIKDVEKDITRAQDHLVKCKESLQALKDIAWDRQSKKESSQMYKVLHDEKSHTSVKSNVGDIRVDKEFMQKEIKKHLDNPNLRGMVTKEEFLSFPKVAKNVEAEYEARQEGYTWQVRANDDSVINYGERDYGEGHRLLTVHSRTGRGERGQLRQEFKDRDFHNPVENIIPQSTLQSQAFDPNDSSDMEALRQKSAEITKQEETRKQENQELHKKSNVNNIRKQQ